jgi:hypothetical protein
MGPTGLRRRKRHLPKSIARAPFLLASTVATTLAAFATLAFLCAPAHAQNTSALIGEALDKQFDIELNDPLPDAMKKIEDKTSVPIKADPVVWELLPWGEQTTLMAKIKNETLRQALQAITRKLGLFYSLGDEAVILKPMAPLRRLGRRATPQELQGLANLATTDLPEIKGVPTVRTVLAAVDARLETIAPYAIEDRLSAELRDRPLDVPRGASLMDAMELLVKQTPATWYPWGKYLVVVTKPTLVSDHLSKTMTVRYTNTDIAQVLEDIRRHSGVDFKIEPGAIERVPPEFRNVKVFWENVSIEQALESLKGLTGLQYEVTDAGVTISNALPPAAAGASGAGTDPVVAMMTLDNGMQVMLRRSELPADVQAYLKHRTEKEVENLRRMMKQEGFKADTAAPATQPSTQPVSAGH